MTADDGRRQSHGHSGLLSLSDGVPGDVSTIAVVASVDGPGTFDDVTLRADVHGGPGFDVPPMTAGETVVVTVEIYRRAT